MAVGDDAEIREACDARTAVLDGTGMTLVPGLVDSHGHPLWGAELARGIDLSGVKDRAQLRAALAGRRNGEVVRGFGLDYAVYAGTGWTGASSRKTPAVRRWSPSLTCTRTWRRRPCWPSRVSTARSSSPITRRSSRAPTGELRELGATATSMTGSRNRRRPSAGGCSSRACSGSTPRALPAGTRWTASRRRSRCCASSRRRASSRCGWWCRSGSSPTPSDAIAEWLRLRDERGALWRAGVAKFFADGVVETGTAWLQEPDTRGGGQDCFWPDPARLRATMLRFARAGFQLATHAIGDHAVRFTLDAYRDAAGVQHRIEHAEVLPDMLLVRFARERVTASMQPLHGQWRLPGGADEWTRRLGERATPAWRAADLLRSGALLVLGSDWPVAPSDPRLGLAYAIGRFDAGQALDPLAALAGYTTAAAAAVGEQHIGGRIAPGLRADLTGFGGDPTRVSAADLPALPVRLTVVGGRIVHDSTGESMATITEVAPPDRPRPPVPPEGALERNAVGVCDLVFFVVAAAAPLTVMAGVAPLAIGRGGIGAPGAYVLTGVVLALFAVGYTAMSRFIRNAGAFYVYISRGLGRTLGLGAAFLATFSYAAIGIGLYGAFAVFAETTFADLFGLTWRGRRGPRSAS